MVTTGIKQSQSNSAHDDATECVEVVESSFQSLAGNVIPVAVVSVSGLSGQLAKHHTCRSAPPSREPPGQLSEFQQSVQGRMIEDSRVVL
jgi:hypothetical protein